MKIKEAEQRTGITAKNIRYYEQEGLLSPARCAENGYREYSEDDVQALKQIRLLRELGVSLRHIRLLRSGEITLRDTMELYAGQISDEIDRLRHLLILCDTLRQTDLPHLDADHYLQQIEIERKQGRRFVDVVHDCVTRCRNILPDPAFWFEPEEPILDAAAFTDALIRWADREGKALDLLHTGMEPVAYVDGQKYLFVLDLPHFIELKGPLRSLLGAFTAYTRFGYKQVYAYPCQI